MGAGIEVGGGSEEVALLLFAPPFMLLAVAGWLEGALGCRENSNSLRFLLDLSLSMFHYKTSELQ